MEIETNTSPADEARLLAQSKKLTLQPVHSEVVAEDLPDSVLVAEHVNGSAIGNIDVDIEQNAAAIVPADPTHMPEHEVDPKSQPRVYILTGVGFLLLAAVAAIVIIQFK